MRDIFEEIFEGRPADPMQAARRGMRPALRKRFYARAQAAQGEGGFAVLLDERPVKTPARHGLVAPTRALAEAIAAEWAAQGERIDPAGMPLTRLANTIIDGVAQAAEAMADDIVKHIACDLVLYRADGPEGLIELQARHWDPVVAWAADALGARFIMVQGVTFAAQPPEAIAAARASLPADAWRLGALHSITTLTGSGLLALALHRGAITRDAAWAAAHVDEDWQMAQWGRDELAMARRDFRFAEMAAATRLLELLR
jgi:chaperone required for assembly of F1-ATPase